VSLQTSLPQQSKRLAPSLIAEKTAENTRATTKRGSKKINFQSLGLKDLAEMALCVNLGKV